MVRLNKLYTKRGDAGLTNLVGGSQVSKASVRVAAMGGIDELNAAIGVCCSKAIEAKRRKLLDQLLLIQQELFDLGSHLACPPQSEIKIPPPQEGWITRLESWIDEITEKLPELRSFVLPGGNLLNSQLHVARCVCRRAEQQIVSLNQVETLDGKVLKYVNRLSDFLFACCRRESFVAKKKEILWVPAGQR